MINMLKPRQNGRISQATFSYQSSCVTIVIFFNSNFAEIYSQGSNQQCAYIGSDNGKALNQRQAIFLTDDGPVY